MVADDPRRAEIAEQITECLRAGTSVHLVGLRSSGRSGVLRGVVERLTDEGVSTTHVRGIRALRDHPLAALAVAGTKLGPAPHQAQLIASSVASLEDQLSPGVSGTSALSDPSVLVVDDADDLDPVTVGAIVAAHARTRVPLVFSSRPRTDRNGPVDLLTAAVQPAVRVDSPPLRFDEVHQVVHDLLGGPVAPAAVAMIGTISGGLPGLVHAVVDAGRRGDHLVLREGLWTARGDLWTPGLIAAARPFLSDLDNTEVETLTVLAVGGTMSLDRARLVSSPQLLADLDEAGLLRILPVAGQDVVGVFPPMIGEFLTRARSAAHRAAAEERLRAVPDEPVPEPVSGHPLGFPGGEPILSHRLARYWAERLARRRDRWEADPNPTNGAALLDALVATDARGYEFDAVVAETRITPATPCAVARFLAVAVLAALLRGERAAATRLLAVDHDPLFDGLFRAVEQHVRVATGTVLPDEDASATEDTAAHQVSRDALRVARAETMVARGDGSGALALLGGFDPAVAPLRWIAEVTGELAMIEECRLDEAIDQARAAIDRARRDHDVAAVQAHAYAAAAALTLRGRLIEVVGLTSSALALAPTPLDGRHFQVGLLTLGAHAAMLGGQVDYARSLARQAEGMEEQDGPLPGMDPSLLPMAIHVGENLDVATDLWKATEQRLASGYLAAALVSGVASIEHQPDRARAEALAEAAAGSTSPLLGQMADYAVAISSGDPTSLAAIVPRLTRAGLRVYAVHGAVAEAIGLRRTGRRAEAATLTHAVWTQAGLRGRDLCGLYTAYDREVNLSVRERQIAVLVARGLGPLDIANRMVLSVRTVENHILHACHKIGVDNREDLAWAARTWLTCAPR